MEQPQGVAADVHAVRLPISTWNAACLAAAGESGALTSVGWGTLVDAGIAAADHTIDPRWLGMIETYLLAPTSVRVAASYRNLLYRSAISVAPASVCVMERFQTRRETDGSLVTVAHDDLLEVAATTGSPWDLMKRVLPPLPTLQARAFSTPPSDARPIEIDPAVIESLRSALQADPNLDVDAFLRRHATGGFADLVDSDDASVSFLFITKVGERLLLGLAWYLASAERLFRATMRSDVPFEQVRPGDLAYTFDWYSLGALDALRAASTQQRPSS